MAIAKRKPESQPPVKLNLAEVKEETYLGIVNDNDSIATTSLLAYIEGMPWTVQYYAQLIGKHNDLRELDAHQDASFQQYQKIKDLELRVDSALQTSYDNTNALTSVTGSANVTSFIPNVNDYFIAEAGSANTALFRVTSSERKAFNRQSVYLINYTLVRYVTNQDDAYQNLEAKTVRTYHFSKDRLVDGLAPILREDQHALTREISLLYKSLVKYYFKTFFNRTYKTLVIPSQPYSIYDPLLVDFLRQIMDTMDADEIRDITYAPIDQDRFVKDGSLWRVLLERDTVALSYVAHKAVIISKDYFNASSWIKSSAYWPLDYFVFPQVSDLARIPGDPTPPASSLVELAGDKVFSNQKDFILSRPDEAIALIHPVLKDEYYLLSEWFYTGMGQASALEILLRDYLKSAAPDLGLLHQLVVGYRGWPLLEQFYYGPLLFLLMKDSVRGFYR